VALCEPTRINIGQPYLAGRILENQRFQWQIDADRTPSAPAA
jgi:hypothetical protein